MQFGVFFAAWGLFQRLPSKFRPVSTVVFAYLLNGYFFKQKERLLCFFHIYLGTNIQ